MSATVERMRERLRRAGDDAGARGLGALVIAPSPDLVYLTGYDPMPLERPTLLIVRPGRDPVLLVPELERPLAAASPAGELADLVGWVDGIDPYAEVAKVLPPAGDVAVGDRIWGVHVLRMLEAVPGLVWSSAAPVLGALRARKDPEELDALRRAGAAADATFADILDRPFAGRTERAVAADLTRLLIEHGHRTAGFAIVAGGPNAASPHHEPGDRPIAAGDVVVLDFGGELDGYFSDTSRTVVVGEPPEGFGTVYGFVHAAQEAAVDEVRPGVPIQEIDRVARAVITDGGFADRFIHRTGHGIGLEVHEPPYAVQGDATILEPGMTFSVEPGIYLPGRFGVRIEDIVAVTYDGVERLNRSTRDLQTVDQ